MYIYTFFGDTLNDIYFYPFYFSLLPPMRIFETVQCQYDPESCHKVIDYKTY
jgi:hypothetical protein